MKDICTMPHGVVYCDPHCVGSDRYHSTQNEWLDTKENVKKIQKNKNKNKRVANQR